MKISKETRESIELIAQEALDANEQSQYLNCLAALNELALDGVSLVAYKDYNWRDNNMKLQRVTCINHPTAKYLTKGPGRSLHFSEAPYEYRKYGLLCFWGDECPCSSDDLHVVIENAELA